MSTKPMIPKDAVFGNAGVAELLGTSPAAVNQRMIRGTLQLEPVARVGRMAIFSRDQVLSAEASRLARHGGGTTTD